MNIIYKKATIDDIVLLTKTRIEVLRAANNLTSDIDMDEVERKTYEYYKEAFQNDTHTAYIVFEDNKFVGAGGVSYYQVMPTYHNPSGKKAYIMNMYTKPLYRRNGIAKRTLALLVEDAKKRGITSISLEATEIGRPLYEKFGFVQMKNEMEYIEIKQIGRKYEKNSNRHNRPRRLRQDNAFGSNALFVGRNKKDRTCRPRRRFS